ncbi:MAG TPA: hypothetical protein VGM54_00045 [Chthoniobacter sp.]|jgi:hypothetical protein
MNSRRRFRSLVPKQEDRIPRRRQPAPASANRKQADKAVGAAWLFADFLAASMFFTPDQLADLE